MRAIFLKQIARMAASYKCAPVPRGTESGFLQVQ